MTSPFTDTSEPKDTELTNVLEDQLKNIVNSEGKQKYATLEDALKALPHSQTHISTLEAELKQEREEKERIREELARAKSVEDFVKEISENKPKEVPPTNEKPSGLDETKVTEIFQKQLETLQQKTLQQTNLDMVMNKLQEEYGEKATEVVSMKAKELDTTPANLEELSKSNPKLVIGLLSGVDVNSSTPKPTEGGVNLPPSDKDDKLEFDFSVMRGGASSEDMADVWNKIREKTRKRLGIETN